MRALLLLGAVALSACTTVTSSGIRRDPPDGSAPAGFAYTLPFAQYEIQTTRRLSACPTPATAREPAKGEFQFVIEATATPRFAPDVTVTMDYQALANAWKTTDYSVALHDNGMLRTVNASSDDRTAQVAGNVVTGIGRLAMLSAGAFPTPTASINVFRGPPQAAARVCSQTAQTNLARLQQLERKLVPEATAAVAARRAEVEDIEAYKAARGELDDARAQKLIEARRKLSDAADALKRLVAERDQVLARISVQSTFLWPTSSKEYASLLTIPAREASFIRTLFTGPDFPDLQKDLALAVILTPATGSPRPDSAHLPPTTAGAVYLTPAQGRLRLCRPVSGAANNSLDICANAPPSDIVLESWGNVPQFGRYAQLPLKNGPLENNVLSATFRADGTLQEARFEARRSAAETASGVFAQATETALTTAGRIDAARTAREQAAVTEATAALQREKTRLETEAEILRLKASSASTSDLALIGAQRELVEAQLALERSQRELTDFRAGAGDKD